MHILYNFFYRQYGVRRLQHLLQPKLVQLTSLPKNCMLHYLTHDQEVLDIDTSKLYLNDYGSKRIIVDFPLEIKGVRDNPKRINGVIRDLTKDFFKQHKNYKYTPDAYTITLDPETLVVNNYNYLDKLYRYPHTPFELYNRWVNTEITRWSTIAKISETCDRQHFVFVNIPAQLPSWNILNLFSDKPISMSVLRVFSHPEDRFLLELWKWLTPELKANSIFKDLKENHLSRINIVFTSISGKSAVLNLGYLNSWISGAKNLTEFSQVEQVDQVKIKKLFLKFLITLNSTIEEPEVDLSEDKVEDLTTKPEEVEDTEVIDDNSVDYSTGVTKDTKVDKTEVPIVKVDDTNIDDDLAESKYLEDHLKDIDAELEELNVINDRQLQAKGIKIGNVEVDEPEVYETKPIEELNAEIYGTPDYTTVLQKHLDKQADFGLISAGDYKKLLAEAKAYPNKKDPYGKNRTIAETIDIKPEDLALNADKNTIVAGDVVKDKSMLKSSLQSFDSEYINKVMDRHMVSVVSSLQRAGVVIRNHEIEVDHSVLGSFENHTLEIRPIDGQPSTLHFRVAKVNEDGSYISGGNKYTQRKNRAD